MATALEVEVDVIDVAVSWATVRRVIATVALERGHWEGYPVPVEGVAMNLHDRHPLADKLAVPFATEPTPDPAPPRNIRNSWESFRDRATYALEALDNGHVRLLVLPWVNYAGAALLRSLEVAGYAWDIEQEQAAMRKLESLISPRAWSCYVTLGAFLETSPRSGVTYVFRRARPTLALRPILDGADMRIIAALCLHPIGHYRDSWAGAMVPTDDVTAHLLLMRGDEHRLWRYANQHPAWSPYAGV